jgi:multisubunit Na+/H+ antiporter MnhG subunit
MLVTSCACSEHQPPILFTLLEMLFEEHHGAVFLCLVTPVSAGLIKETSFKEDIVT